MPATVTVSIAAALSKAADIGEVSAILRNAYPQTFADGIADGQFDQIYTDTFSIAASGTLNYDVRGSLLDVFGSAFTPAEIVGLICYADAANVNNVVLGNDTNAVPIFSAVTASIAIRPGSLFAITASGAGIATTAATGDIIKLTNSGAGTAVTGGIILLGRSV